MGGKLKRTLNLPMLTLYGVGTIIGAGIYALVGEIAGVAGYGAPLSFLVAAVIAAFTACSFAELAGRFPRAAGAALYVQQGFGDVRLARAVGLLVALAGVVSAAALANAFNGYLQGYVDVQRHWIIISLTLALGALAAWGIVQSAAVAVVITLVEVGGLLLVIGVSAEEIATLPERWQAFLPGPASPTAAGGVLLGVTLAFYAFIGFEDMVDVAEEVRNVRRTLPRAIVLTLAITTLLYLLIALSAVSVLPPESLAGSDAPLVAVYQAQTGRSAVAIGVIAMLAIVNGALVQIVMASRVLYGLSSRGQLPELLGRVSSATRTPLYATAVTMVSVLCLALYGRLASLASATSLLMLTTFALVNLALWRVKGRAAAPPQTYDFPRPFPLVGFVLCAGFVGYEIVRRL